MHPHPNYLPRWLHRLMYVSGAVLLLSGLGWDALHYGSGNGGLPQPAEPWLMRTHGLAMLGFLMALGGLGPVHVPRGWRLRRNRASGIVLMAAAALLLGTGYALYYWTSDATRDWVGISHAVVGTAMSVVIFWHRLPQATQAA